MTKLKKIRHHMNHEWKLETLAVLVIVLSVSILNLFSINTTAYALMIQTIALNGGDEVQVGCRDGSLPKSTLSGLVVRVSCALAAITPAPATNSSSNLIDNGTFDAGLGSWASTSVAAVNGVANLTGGQAYVSQKINQKLQLGQTYTITADVKVNSSGSITWGGPQLAMAYYQDLGDSGVGFVRANRLTTGSWQRLTMDRTISDASKNIYVGVRNFGFDGQANIDNVTVVVKGSTANAPGGVVTMTAPAPGGTATSPMPTDMVMPPTITTGGTNSVAFGIWSPTDAKYAVAGPQKYPVCSKAAHDSFYVIGPDGKKYPTWHPALTTDPATGQRCSFGHEHGRNPAGYAYWNEVKTHFAFDGVDGCPKDGQITSCETGSAHTGLPFGYVNEQMTVDASLGFMRHEDHVGHKVEFANGEGDIGEGTDPFNSSTTGGVYAVFEGRTGEQKFIDSGVHCYHLHKIHQGVHSPDALFNNMHEFVGHERCTSTNANYPASALIISAMISFGGPNEFTQFCSDDRFKIIATSGAVAGSVGGNGFRNIITKDCVDRRFLVPDGQFSDFSYEDWDAASAPALYKANGSLLAALNSGAWEVLDAIRYYDPTKANKIGYFADLCSVRGDRQFRGGQCTDVPLGVTWNDTRSPFKGLHRGQYMSAPTLSNSGGATIWYTDALGRRGSTTPFAGSVKQYVASVNANFVTTAAAAGRTPAPRIVQRTHDSGEGTVHAPN